MPQCVHHGELCLFEEWPEMHRHVETENFSDNQPPSDDSVDPTADLLDEDNNDDDDEDI